MRTALASTVPVLHFGGEQAHCVYGVYGSLKKYNYLTCHGIVVQVFLEDETNVATGQK